MTINFVRSGSSRRQRLHRHFTATAIALTLLSSTMAALDGCAPRSNAGGVSQTERTAIAKQIDSLVRDAYDPTRPNMDARMLALYADTGRIVSSTGGRVVTSRDTIAEGIHYFWKNVGLNMRGPQWIWTQTYVDVLGPNAAVFTGTYHVPHHTPMNQPHDIGGAMTLVFVKRGGKWGIVQEHLSDAAL